MATTSRSSLKRYYDVNGWLFVAPAVALISCSCSIRSSARSSCPLFGPRMMLKFSGTGNLVRLWNDPVFWKALENTVIFFVVQVPIMITMALILAAMLNNPKLRYSGLFRTMIFLPCVSSLVAYSILFKSMFRSTAW